MFKVPVKVLSEVLEHGRVQAGTTPYEQHTLRFPCYSTVAAHYKQIICRPA